MNEHREHARYDKEMKIEYEFSNNNIISTTCGKVYNISLGGIYMVTELLVDKNSSLDLLFSFVKDDELIVLKTTGNVLRSGTVNSDQEITKKYKPSPEDGAFFAVIKFSEPFAELSFMLH
ncbi:MAG TPA: PilZ domain-containing protein [Spirochaetota bacterium]|nr:PilZ domain-containing protein [Spirochaetota bacterium]HPS85829.1 PilZ domain-containing protein [Spirochaetota bacterium]